MSGKSTPTTTTTTTTQPAPKKTTTTSGSGGDVEFGSNGKRTDGFVGNAGDDGRGDEFKFRRRTPEEIAERKAKRQAEREAKRQARLRQRQMERRMEMAYEFSAGGYGGYNGGYNSASSETAYLDQVDAYEEPGMFTSMMDTMSEAAASVGDLFETYEDPYLRDEEGNKTQWGEASVTTYEDVFLPDGTPRDTHALEKNSVLYIGYGPEDMKWLDLEAERKALGGSDEIDLTSFINPTDELLAALAASGNFTTVVIGGHGTEGSLYTTDADGKSRERSGDEMAAMFKGSSIESVFVNACQGGQGAESVADSFNEVGMNVMSWMSDVKDSNAIAVAGAFVSFTNLISRGASTEELESAFARFETVGHDLAFDLRELITEHGPDSGSILKAMGKTYGSGFKGGGRGASDDYDSYYGGSVYDSYGSGAGSRGMR